MRGHQLRQMEEKAARRAAERAAGRQGVVANGGPNAEEEAEERARFLEMATLALAQAEAEGTPTYPLRRAVHAALYPAPLSAAMVKPKPKKEDKAAGAPAAAAPVKKCVVSSKAAKAPSAG